MEACVKLEANRLLSGDPAMDLIHSELGRVGTYSMIITSQTLVAPTL